MGVRPSRHYNGPRIVEDEPVWQLMRVTGSLQPSGTITVGIAWRSAIPRDFSPRLATTGSLPHHSRAAGHRTVWARQQDDSDGCEGSRRSPAPNLTGRSVLLSVACLGLCLGLAGCLNPIPHRTVVPPSGSAAPSVQFESSFWVDAKIDGGTARLWLDTAATGTSLYTSSAERLGLELPSDRPVDAHPKPYWTKRSHLVELWGVARRQWVAVMELPHYLRLPEDGLVGWHTIRKNIVMFDAARERIAFLSRVPDEAETWIKLPVVEGYRELVLGIPGSGRGRNLILVDTGIWSGVGLAPEKWKAFKEVNRDQPTTLSAGYTMFSGIVVREQAWADRLTFGPVELTDVIVEEDTGAGSLTVGDDHLATWGMAVLKRVQLIVDGRRKVAYVKPERAPAPTPEHNRLGAVFVPPNPQSEELVARVAERSPAFEAGIRDGDVLLRSGDRDVSKWRKSLQMDASMSGPMYPPPGTRADLTLKRGEQVFSTTVVLRDILNPSNAAMPATE
jgi:hypothetical protein